MSALAGKRDVIFAIANRDSIAAAAMTGNVIRVDAGYHVLG